MIVPEHGNFTGHAILELKIARRLSMLRLHGSGLSVDQAYLESGSARVSTRVETNGDEFLGFALERPVGPGRARLHVTYHGAMSDEVLGSGSYMEGNGGLFRRQYNSEWYAATFLQQTYARRVFPCFDEPCFRIPWRVTLHVRREHLAVANSPAESETEEPGGMKCVRFAETQPLPSYLVGFRVGPFEAVSLGRVGKKGTPVRIITPRGRTAEAAFLVRASPAWLRLVEEYCGVPFPYPKLDHVIMPGQPNPGMEDAGLITYHEYYGLAATNQEPADFKWDCADIATHEIVHQYFGNSVGIPSWDRVWLKEAFALFISRKVLHQWNPDQHELPGESVLSSFNDDGPLSGTNWLDNGDWNIPQVIGVLTTFESWVGEKTFQKSIQKFYRQQAGKTATSADFARALSAASGQDLTQAFSTFTEQPGAPLVKLQLKEGARGKPILVLAQERLRAIGASPKPECLWGIPIRLRYQAHGQEERLAILLKDPHAEVALKAAPEWVLVNEGAAGYYRVAYPISLVRALLSRGREHLSAVERLGLVEDLRASVASGQLLLGEVLPLLPPLLNDPDARVVTESAQILKAARELTPEGLRTNSQRFVRAAMVPALDGARWQSRPGENAKARTLRLARLGLEANEGEDPRLITDARILALQWLTNRTSLETEAVPVVLGVAGRYCDRALLEQFVTEAKRTTNSDDHFQLFTALGSCRDPGLLKSILEALVAREYPPDDAAALLEEACAQVENRTLIYDFARQHSNAVMAVLPESERLRFLIRLVRNFSDGEHRADVERFLKEHASLISDGAPTVAELLAGIDRGCAFRKFHQRSVQDYLRNQ